jgi:diaminopimelate decarboxylase
MEVGKQVGHRMKILDLGGGFPAHKMTNDQVKTIQATQNNGFITVAEPGRHFS